MIQYADRNVELNGTHPFFATPCIPYTTLLLLAQVTDYACLLTKAFAQATGGLVSLPQSPLLRPGGQSVCGLGGEQAAYSTSV